MSKCVLKVFGVFGVLLVLAAFFFVPVRIRTVSEQVGASGIGTRTTMEDDQYVLLPMFLRGRGLQISERTGAKVTTSLRSGPYALELGVIALLGIVDCGLFCFLPRLRRRN